MASFLIIDADDNISYTTTAEDAARAAGKPEWDLLTLRNAISALAVGEVLRFEQADIFRLSGVTKEFK